MVFTKNIIFIVLMLLILSSAGCNVEENSEENNQEDKETPGVIEEMGSGLLEIMQQADLIPVIEMDEEDQANRDAETGEQEGDEQEGAEEVDEPTFEETILGEVLKREIETESQEQELPEDTEEIWDNIKITITELHDQWNELEPLLVRENVSGDQISDFEEDLDSLTVFSTEQNRFAVLTAANRLTGHLANFMVPFAENPVSKIYELKFHLRTILLQAAANNYEEARGILADMKEQRESLTYALEKEDAEELDISLNNLQGALDKQNPGLVNIKAAIVMEKLVQVIEKLE